MNIIKEGVSIGDNVDAKQFIGKFDCPQCGCIFKEREEFFCDIILVDGNDVSLKIGSTCPNCKNLAYMRNPPVMLFEKSFQNMGNVFIKFPTCNVFHRADMVQMEQSTFWALFYRTVVYTHVRCDYYHCRQRNLPIKQFPAKVKEYISNSNPTSMLREL